MFCAIGFHFTGVWPQTFQNAHFKMEGKMNPVGIFIKGELRTDQLN